VNVRNPPSPVSGIPRVFLSFQDTQGVTHELTFRRRVSLLFTAVYDESQEVFVKIIYGSYGEEVHMILADEKMAPELLGISRIERGPTMIVMEMLDNSCETHHVFTQKNARRTAEGVKPAILERLEDIRGEGACSRRLSFMVKPGEETLAVLIDFDWVDKAGEACYPLNRNEEGIRWSGPVCSIIGLSHDRGMLSVTQDSS